MEGLVPIFSKTEYPSWISRINNNGEESIYDRDKAQRTLTALVMLKYFVDMKDHRGNHCNFSIF